MSGKGTIGSEILEKIHHHCPDLNLLWLITGEGHMLRSGHPHELKEDTPAYQTKDDIIALLKEQITVLQQSNADKDKIIALLEKRLAKRK